MHVLKKKLGLENSFLFQICVPACQAFTANPSSLCPQCAPLHQSNPSIEIPWSVLLAMVPLLFNPDFLDIHASLVFSLGYYFSLCCVFAWIDNVSTWSNKSNFSNRVPEIAGFALSTTFIILFCEFLANPQELCLEVTSKTCFKCYHS